MSRISNITNNTTHTMNSTNNRYQVKNWSLYFEYLF
jgi:hypothetical protein